jgi:hypothetical protein
MRFSPVIVAGLISVGIASIVTVVLSLVGPEVELPMMGPVPVAKHLAGLTTVAWASVVPLFVVLRRGMAQALGPRDQPRGDDFWSFSIVSGLLLVCGYLVIEVTSQAYLDLVSASLGKINASVPGDALMLMSMAQTVLMAFVVYAIILVVIGWQMHQRRIARPLASVAVVMGMFIAARAVDTLRHGSIPLDFAVQKAISASVWIAGMCIVTLLAYGARAATLWLGNVLARGAPEA